jgi:hypothetical protein
MLLISDLLIHMHVQQINLEESTLLGTLVIHAAKIGQWIRGYRVEVDPGVVLDDLVISYDAGWNMFKHGQGPLPVGEIYVNVCLMVAHS